MIEDKLTLFSYAVIFSTILADNTHDYLEMSIRM